MNKRNQIQLIIMFSVVQFFLFNFYFVHQSSSRISIDNCHNIDEKTPKTSLKSDWNYIYTYDGSDEARTIVVDHTGNIFISGTEYNAFDTSYDIFITKFGMIS